MSRPAPASRVPGAWLIWSIGVCSYAAAVFHRTSLGVAGLEAQRRFGVGAGALSLFPVIQLAVYAAMQVPVGVLLDRFGSRRLITAGALIMATGQLAMALAETLPVALTARLLVGVGDAMTFISVLRLAVVWFPPSRVPVITQLTGVVGQLGQILAAYPLLALLDSAGWTAAFAVAAAVSLGVGGVVAASVTDQPPAAASASGPHRHDVLNSLREAWREPGTRLGLWAHFVTQFSGTTFGLLWGYPFLVEGQHRSPATAGLLLTVMVATGMLIGPVLGGLVGRWPLRRSVLVLMIVGSSAVMWSVVLAWPGRVPLGVLVLLVLVLATNGPGSMIGFDYGRTYNPPERVGSATGIINVGGFVATLSTILAIGLILDAATPPGTDGYPMRSFRIAFGVQYLVWALGLWVFLWHRGVVRRRLAERGIVIDPFHRAVARKFRSRNDPDGSVTR